MTPRDFIDGTQILAWILAVALFLRMRRSLAATESERDSLRSALTLARREAADLRLANQGLTEDLNGWKMEEAKRERRRVMARLN